MSLFSTLFNVGIARRVGLWALIQALPDEDALQVYLRAAYKGLAGVIIGSVLTGSAIAAGIAAAYNFMLESGWTTSQALGATAGFTLLLIIACFALASRWFVQLAGIKDDYSITKQHPKAHSLSGFVNHAVSDVADGFIEGFTRPRNPSSQQTTTSKSKNKPAGRPIRLIN